MLGINVVPLNLRRQRESIPFGRRQLVCQVRTTERQSQCPPRHHTCLTATSRLPQFRQGVLTVQAERANREATSRSIAAAASNCHGRRGGGGNAGCLILRQP